MSAVRRTGSPMIERNLVSEFTAIDPVGDDPGLAGCPVRQMPAVGVRQHKSARRDPQGRGNLPRRGDDLAFPIDHGDTLADEGFQHLRGVPRFNLLRRQLPGDRRRIIAALVAHHAIADHPQQR